MKRMSSTPRYSSGLSLIEMMVAVLIASFLIFGLLQVFTASKAAYQTAEGMARVQENARFAMDFLQRDIRMAGHFGCVNDQAHWVKEEGDPVLNVGGGVISGGGAPLDFSVSIEGYEAPGSGPTSSLTLGGAWAAPTGVPTLTPTPVGGSDVLVLRYFAPEGVPVDTIAAAGSGESVGFDEARWRSLTSDGVAAPSVYGVSDCTHANVFTGSGSAGAVLAGAGNDLAGRYTPAPTGQTMLYRADAIAYYVGINDQGNPALYRARAVAGGAGGAFGGGEELVEGIQSLQLLYGQDDRAALTADTPPIGNITWYGTAANVRSEGAADVPNAWRRVGVVQVGILAVSPNIAAAPAAEGPIRVLGTSFQPAASGDRLFRASYEVTVALRNRLFGN